MIFQPTKISGAFELTPELKTDERGFFARTWCQKEFADHGLNPRLVQCNISFNQKKGTLRGIHFQAPPFAEAKLVRCTRGLIYDVVVDLRSESPTFKQWVAIVLSPGKRNMAYVPESCGHGFLTLEDETEVLYQMSEFYHPELSRGVRWNDPAFRISWPDRVAVISDRDRDYPNFSKIDELAERI